MLFRSVLAILAVLVLFAVPNILNVYNTSIDDTMRVQEQEMVDAANLFIQDSCGRNALNNDRKGICSAAISGNKAYFTTNVVVKYGYTETINHRGSGVCDGFIEYNYSPDTGRFSDGKTYIYCGDTYFTGQNESNHKYSLQEIKNIHSTYSAKEN